MRSGLYGFNQILEDVKQETGITNLRNKYVAIKKLIARAEFDINPYAGFLIKKSVLFIKGNGNFDGTSIKLPQDYVFADEDSCCSFGVCNFRQTISHIVLCDGITRDRVVFTYWGLQCDGEGNPVVTYNHSEAVVAYIVWKLYSPKVFIGEGSANLSQMYKQNYENLLHQSRGSDFFPSEKTMASMRKTNLEAIKDIMGKLKEDTCVSCDCIESSSDEKSEIKIHWWQLNSISDRITQSVTDSFLLDKQVINYSDFKNGITLAYQYVGQIGFSFENVEPNEIKIKDILGAELSNTFNSYYDFDKKRITFVSNDYITQSSIYFKVD